MFRFGAVLQRSAIRPHRGWERVRSVSAVLIAVFAASAIALATGPLLGSAVADPTYGVMNAPEGVYWRSEPNWAAAERITGFGVYNSTTIEVHCYQSGTTVEGSADTMWEQATDVGGPGYGNGWLNEHFINDGQPINQPSPGVPPCNAPAPPEEHQTSGGGLVFPIFNAEGGIYYRNSPHWADTSQTPGVGVYNGDQVELICGAYGDPVGPFNDTAWSYVNNLSRSVGDGWVNEHYINDGALSNQFVAGEPMCGSNVPGVTSGSSASPGGGSAGSPGGGSTPSTPGSTPNGSLYYSPYPANPHGPNSTGQIKVGNHWVSAPSPATLTVNLNEWDKKADKKGCPALESFAPEVDQPALNSGQITTLASWSLARFAPFLLLQDSLKAHTNWFSNIHYILLFDPGTQKQLDSSACANEYSMGTILQKWLTANSANKLVVLSGVTTADAGHSTELGLGHAGIQDQLFTPLKVLGDRPGQAPRTQVVVCNYDTMSHEDVWINFKSWMNKPPISLGSCPVDPRNNKRPVSWNP